MPREGTQAEVSNLGFAPETSEVFQVANPSFLRLPPGGRDAILPQLWPITGPGEVQAEWSF